MINEEALQFVMEDFPRPSLTHWFEIKASLSLSGEAIPKAP